MLLLQPFDVALNLLAGALSHHHFSIQVTQEMQVCGEVPSLVQFCPPKGKDGCSDLQILPVNSLHQLHFTTSGMSAWICSDFSM